MKLKELKTWIESLPVEFLEFDVVNAEFVKIVKDDITYRLDKPVTDLSVNDESKEILILNS